MAELIRANLKLGQSGKVELTDLSADTSTATLTAWRDGDVLVAANNEDTGDVVMTISGKDVTDYYASGVGTIDVSAGFQVTVPNGETHYVDLTKYRAYLGGAGNEVTVTSTNATGKSFAYVIG